MAKLKPSYLIHAVEMTVLCFKVSLNDSFSDRPHNNKHGEFVILMFLFK